MERGGHDTTDQSRLSPALVDATIFTALKSTIQNVFSTATTTSAAAQSAGVSSAKRATTPQKMDFSLKRPLRMENDTTWVITSEISAPTYNMMTLPCKGESVFNVTCRLGNEYILSGTEAILKVRYQSVSPTVHCRTMR
jgi:hypothetical protein